MKNVTLVSPFIFALLAILVSSGCSRPKGTAKIQAPLPFSFTSVVLDDGSTAWIVQATNGVFFEMERGKLSMNVSVDSSVTVWFDHQKKRIVKTLLETPNTGDRPGQWVTDFNGDGIPDRRRVKGKDMHEVFYQGQWLESKPASGTNVFVTVDGRQIVLYFDGEKWSDFSQKGVRDY